MHLRIFLTFYLLLQISVIQAQTPTILRTIPSDANVFDMEKNELGQTPFDLSKLKTGNKEIRISKEGYETIVIAFAAKPAIPLFPGSVISCPSCNLKIDAQSNNENLTGALVLRKKTMEHESTIMVAIDTPRIQIRPETELGKINSNRVFMSDRDVYLLLGYPENMKNTLTNPFDDTYFDAYTVSSWAKEKTNLYKPKIILKPVIKSISFTLKGKLMRDYTGPCSINCTWNIADISDTNKILGSLNITSSIFRFQGNYELILQHMMFESEKDLLGNDTLYSFIAKLEENYLSRSKKEPFPINRPGKKSYSDTKEMLKEITQSVVTIENDDGFGSGSLISEEGYILTSYHVIEDEKNIYVRSGTKDKIKAQIIRVNKDYDLALLKIEGDGFKALKFGNSSQTDVGDEIYAAGTPLDKSLRQSVSKGIVSGFRQWNGVNFLQTDVSINSGNSGGPMLNSKGEIIGITTMKKIGRGIEGIGFGIPSNVVIEMLNLQLQSIESHKK